MKNKLTTQEKWFFGAVAFVMSLMVSQLAEAASMNIMKDAEDRQNRQTRCLKSQQRTESLIKIIDQRLDYENRRNKHQQDELAKRSDDDRASYLNAVIIDRSQAMTDIEGFLEKVSHRLDLISGENICTGVSGNNNKQYAVQLREASRKLQEQYEWLEKKVQPTTND